MIAAAECCKYQFEKIIMIQIQRIKEEPHHI